MSMGSGEGFTSIEGRSGDEKEKVMPRKLASFK